MLTKTKSELVAERQKAIAEAKAITAAATADGRDLTDEEDGKIRTRLAAVDLLAVEIADVPDDVPDNPDIPAPVTGRAPLNRPQIAGIGRQSTSVAGRLFGESTDTAGFASIGEYLQVVGSGCLEPRLSNLATNQEGVPAKGGFHVPEGFQNAFIDDVLEQTVFVQLCRAFRMTTETLKIPGIDGFDHTTGTYGGLDPDWVGELPTLTEQDIESRLITFKAKKCMGLNRSSNDLLSDAPDWENHVYRGLVASTAFKLDYACLRGDGAGKALGCLNADSRIAVAKETSQTAATIWYSNLVSMFARLHPASYKTARWFFNPTCIPQLMQLNLHQDAGSGSLVGDGVYPAFRERDGKFTIFGRPADPTEKLPVLGTEGDIMLADPQMYGLAVRQDITIERSAHAGFQTDSTYFRSKMRADGMPLWPEAVTPKHGDTLSWCVTLATRA